MANYVLSCCSTADLSKEHFQSRDIHYVCFHYAMNGKEYLDDLGESMSFEDFYKAMADGAVACGIPRAKAMDYAAMTLSGAAEMYLSTHQHPGALKDAVCSPGGSTIVGVRTLEEHGFRGAVMNCIQAAYEKNQALGK